MKFLKLCIKISIFFVTTWKVGILETHSALDENDQNQISFVSNSIYLTQQPHSLISLFNQIKWERERFALYTFIKKQEKTIKKRYDDDDPELEKKIHETDINCIQSKPLDLRTEYFIETYSVELVPKSIYNLEPDQNTQITASTHETLQISAIKDLFLIDEIIETDAEPICQNYVEGDEILDNKANLLPNVAEPNLANLNENQLRQLASYLYNCFQTKETQPLALYYSSFYWRLQGESKNAVKCLLRYLKINPKSNSAKFQLGMLYLRLKKYTEAVELLKPVTDEVTKCTECFLALGDAYVLTGNFLAAISAYEHAVKTTQNLKIANKKIALLKCVIKVFEVMEKQHANLLDAIDDVQDYKKKVKKLKLLKTYLKNNMLNHEHRLQSKFAYEHYTVGPIPHLNCFGLTHKTPLFNGNVKEIEGLHCKVDDLEAFNLSLVARYHQILKTTSNTKKELTKLTQAEIYKNEMRNLLQDYMLKMPEYIKKLTPYIAMVINSPSLEPKYLSKNKTLPKLKLEWPTLEECEKEKNLYINHYSNLINNFFHEFLSPSNKGFKVSDLLTRYLALDKNKLMSLPWRIPFCPDNQYVNKNNKTFISSFKSVKELINNEKIYEVGDKRLKAVLMSLADAESKTENFNKQNESKLSLGDLGQRITMLLKYKIGPDWILKNLAGLYLRYFGLYGKALKCLSKALENDQYKDIAYIQIAQILIKVFIEDLNINDKTKKVKLFEKTNFESKIYLDDAELILKKALEFENNEPLTYVILALAQELNNKTTEAITSLQNALQIDSNLKSAKDALFQLRCQKKIQQKIKSNYFTIKNLIQHKYPPLCCWPNQQNIFCFKKSLSNVENNVTTKNNYKQMNNQICFILESKLDLPHSLDFVYFRCNTPYTGYSYKAPAYAYFIAPILRSANEIRQTQMLNNVKSIQSKFNELHMLHKKKAVKKLKISAMSLDTGGFSKERIQKHSKKLLTFNVKNLHQFSILYINKSTNNTIAKLNIDNSKKKLKFNVDEKVIKIENKQTSHKTPLPSFANILNQSEILKYDIPRPIKIPQPPLPIVVLGKMMFKPSNTIKIKDYCKDYKKEENILEQKTSTFVSATAKIFYFNTPLIQSLIDQNNNKIIKEPICPNPKLSTVLKKLDALPAYKYRQHLKFYWPEKALQDALQNLGINLEFESNHLLEMDKIAQQLYYAMKYPENKDVDWTLTTASSLYWRVKGDAVNALKCLRYSFENSPSKMKYIALISMANIYHQAGFLHSALIVGGQALEISPNSVVTIHFTLANILASMGEYARALDFYYSTLALQSNFQGAKDRIQAIYCNTY